MLIKNMITTIDNYGTTQPDAVAYNFLGNEHTYQDLKENSDSLASHLDQMPIPVKSPVLVFGGQEYEMLATFLGLSKSGHAYIPVDTHSSLERINNIIEVGQPSLIIAINPLPLLPDVPVITLDELQTIISTKVSYELTHPVTDDDNYYIIFTSGTTGLPKGVQISHTNLLSFTNWMINSDIFAIPTKPKMLSQPPYSFDLSVMYWAPTLTLGGTLYALPTESTANLKALFTTLAEMPIEVWTSTPSFAEMALLSPDFNSQNHPSLKYFYFDGEELTLSTVKKLKQQFPTATIVNAYGPTEATVAISAIQITDDIIANADRLPIGYPKPDTPIYVIDENGTILAANQPGEIIATGPAISKGYLHNAEKTAAAFFELNGAPAYHTGDAGYFDDAGILHYNGRLDFQIKFNGYRIELEDVSQILTSSNLVEMAVAVPRYNAQHKVKQLLAYIVLKKDISEQFEKDLLLTKIIKNDLKDVMMPYMMPSRFIYRESLPLTANGKVDIKTLIAEVNQND